MDTIKALQRERRNSHFLLVDGMSKLANHSVETCQSSVFQVFGLKWKLIIYPAGEDRTKEYISFYLRIKDKKSLGSNWEVTCSFKLSVVSQTRPQKLYSCEFSEECYDENEACHGKECFMPHTLLNHVRKGYLVNDKIVFCAEITDVQTNFPVTKLPRSMGTAERLTLIDVPRNNSRFTWKITQFSSFNAEDNSSYEFTAGPRRWTISMYPQGCLKGKGNSLSLFLCAAEHVISGPKAKTLAVYKLRVLDQLHRNHSEQNLDYWFSYDPKSKNSSWGEDQFLSLEALEDPSRGFLVNDQIYIGVEFLLVSTTEYL